MNLQDRILKRLQETRASKKTQAAADRARTKDAEDRREREERILAGKKRADKKKEAVRQANIINNPKGLPTDQAAKMGLGLSIRKPR